MKATSLLLALTILTSLYAPAQISFRKAFEGSGEADATSLQQTSDGGYIIVGKTKKWAEDTIKSRSFKTDVYLMKIDANGNTLWTKTHREKDSDAGYDVQETSDGGYVIVGRTKSYGAGSTDVYLIKTNRIGDMLWFKTYGGSKRDYGYAIQPTTDGGFIITGRTKSFLRTKQYDVYLLKIKANGKKQWEKTYGGRGNDYGYYLEQTSDGGYIVVGCTKSDKDEWYEKEEKDNVETKVEKTDIYLIKVNADGDVTWTKAFGNSFADAGYSVQQTTDGGYIITGKTNITYRGTDQDVYLIKTDSYGIIEWEQTFGGKKCEYGTSVQQLTDGGYIVAGHTNSFGKGNYDAYLIRTNPKGQELWSKTYGGSKKDFILRVQQTNDGGFVLAGLTQSVKSEINNVYIIKTDKEGKTVWFRPVLNN